jgi:hypothetical protein
MPLRRSRAHPCSLQSRRSLPHGLIDLLTHISDHFTILYGLKALTFVEALEHGRDHLVHLADDLFPCNVRHVAEFKTRNVCGEGFENTIEGFVVLLGNMFEQLCGFAFELFFLYEVISGS